MIKNFLLKLVITGIAIIALAFIIIGLTVPLPIPLGEVLVVFSSLVLLAIIGSIYGFYAISDLYLDEANGILTAKARFREKVMPLKDMEIFGYDVRVASNAGLTIYTNLGTIRAYSTTKNWLAAYRLFKIKNFNRANKFVEDVNRWGIDSFDPNNPEEP